jgi:DNA-binding transcriptional regulator LsrR (DeoR family)
VAIESLKGPAELVLATSVARRFYLDGHTKIEIADELHLSRFKVARLLDLARMQGLVKIEISSPGTVDVEQSARLQDAFGLRHALVLDTHEEDEAALRRQLGQATAELLTEIITPADVLGLAWARSVSAMATTLHRLPAIPVVQLTGALSRSSESSSAIDTDSSIDVVREVARISGGPAYLFFAPFLVPDAVTAQALLRQPDVARAFAKIGSVTRAVIGVGRWAPAQSTLYEAATDAEREGLAAQGVTVDMAGVFLDAGGHPVHTPLNERMIAVSAAQLAAIDEVIAISYGLNKVPAVRAALHSGIIHSVVTHATLAAALLGDE